MPRGSTFYRAPGRPGLEAPAPRARNFADGGHSRERHGRYEATPDVVTTGDVIATVFVFSGHPDRIDLTARTNPAKFVLDDFDGRESDPIQVEAGTTRTVFLPRRRVQAFNCIGGNNAEVSVCGYYNAPGEPFDAAP